MKLERKTVYFLDLYISGMSPRSIQAVSNLKRLCAERMQGLCKIKIFDLYKNPTIAKKKNIIAIPTLIKTRPLPERRLIGNLAATEQTLKGLGLA